MIFHNGTSEEEEVVVEEEEVVEVGVVEEEVVVEEVVVVEEEDVHHPRAKLPTPPRLLVLDAPRNRPPASQTSLHVNQKCSTTQRKVGRRHPKR